MRITLLWLWTATALAQDALPACLTRPADTAPKDAVPANTPDAELLARLVHAEATSTGFPDDPAVHRAIAWGVMNRVRLADHSEIAAGSYGRGVRGVAFRSGQFNPAVSPRSPFAEAMLCPSDPGRWAMSAAAAREALGDGPNPFLATAWEQTHGLSLVVNFYYPRSIQARGPLAPWESSTTLRFLGDLDTPSLDIGAERVRFYRLTTPPPDVR
ncbi:MAG: hypothetical protein RLZZ383_1233 [Pseudomonadota bacterium]|jgi:hypothetical protein